MSRPDRPRFSIVTAVYDVEPYLPDFIDSIERQRVCNADLEVIAVDDGSTDGSRALLDAWAARSRFSVRVLAQENAGQGAARNRGLDSARGEWVTFTDPDDMLEEPFLQVSARFADRHPGIEVMTARPVFFEERTGRFRDTHPRRHQYERGDRAVDLTAEPNVFLGVSAGSLFRLDRIADLGLRFDLRVRPNFEDGHFAVKYLLGLPEPRLGVLHDAVYVYRKRAAGTSTLQRSLADPDRYTAALEHGYLDVLNAARERYGAVPTWLQSLLVYELSWYLSADEKITSEAHLAPDIVPRFHELLARILRQLDPDVVAAFDVRGISALWVDLLSRGGRDVDWHSPELVRTGIDEDMGLVRLNYRFTGRQPVESFEGDDGTLLAPAFAKTMAHRWYERDLLFERIVWLPRTETLRVRLDASVVPVSGTWPARPRRWRGRTLRDRIWLYRHVPVGVLVAGIARRIRRVQRKVIRPSMRRIAGSPPFATRFRDAWVVMDRVHDADDNGERLFEHLQSRRPDVNAWFVIERDTPDWHRLRAAGTRRLVAHGSFTWKMLMLSCRWLISSHVDAPIIRPPQLGGVRPPRPWKIAFLQHGVIKDDLSRWLNPKDLRLFVVSTAAELDSVAGDGTAYRFTHKETRLTGLPRFDRLLEKGRAVPLEDRNLVIVSPTWRSWLTLPLAAGTQRRDLDAAFWDSEYIRSWLDILRSPAIADAVARRGWRLGFMPHPNLQSILDALDLPAHVERLAFSGTDVQALYGQCALLVTDYSSVAFNVAYLDRPVVYYQFDREAMLGGAHVGRRGYFEYERDGYGPVAEDLATAEAAIVAAIEAGPQVTPEYQARIDAAFPVRDGGASARVVAAIEALDRPYVAAPS